MAYEAEGLTFSGKIRESASGLLALPGGQDSLTSSHNNLRRRNFRFCYSPLFFFFNVTWLLWVLVVAHGIFDLRGSMRDL